MKKVYQEASKNFIKKEKKVTPELAMKIIQHEVTKKMKNALVSQIQDIEKHTNVINI